MSPAVNERERKMKSRGEMIGCVERTLSTTVPSYASLPNGRDPLNPA